MRTPTIRGTAALTVSAAVLFLVLIQPNHPQAMTWGALRLFPLELPVILLALLALPVRGPLTVGARLLLVLAMTAIAVLKVADYASFTALNRGFNIAVDLHLVDASVRLLAGTLGPVMAGLVVVVVGLVVALLGAVLWWATGVWARIGLGLGWRAALSAGAAAAAAFAVAEIGQASRWWSLPFDPPGAAFTARVGVERVVLFRTARQEFRAFERLASDDAAARLPGLLEGLDGADVIVLFVESYGRSSFVVPLYAETHVQTLEAGEGPIRAAGLEMRSGWLTSPIAGGRSWLAHATFGSGLRIASEPQYAAYIASARRSLHDLSRDAGYRTAAVVPAITMPWPEGPRLGFDTILPAAALGYRGAPFNWVTMPDQYTLTMLDRLVRSDDTLQPLFAEVALISSHAPWVPVPELIAWDAVGDGTEFNVWALSGDPPDVVWRDRDRVRDQYRQAVDYALQTVLSYAARQDRDTLLIVLGDHQSAPFVAMTDSMDVPIHMIGSPELLARVDAWGWAEGMVPGPETPVWPMEAFRDRFIAAFSGIAETQAAGPADDG